MMRDSNVSEKWLKATIDSNPPKAILDSAGKPTGRFTTGPVRLIFPNLFSPRTDDSGNEKYDTVAMWPPGVDMGVFSAELSTLRETKLKDKPNLAMPFRRQEEKADQYQGFTPGGLFCNVKSKFKPQIVNPRMDVITDEQKVYSGVWAILAIHFYAYSQRGNNGIATGLDSVMIIGDDDRLDGGGSNPETAFAAVEVTEPIADPSAAFGQAGAGETANDPYGGLV